MELPGRVQDEPAPVFVGGRRRALPLLGLAIIRRRLEIEQGEVRAAGDGKRVVETRDDVLIDQGIHAVHRPDGVDGLGPVA